MSDAPRILFLDIETKPALVATFGIRDQYIDVKQIREHGGTFCVGVKWLGERKTRVLSEWEMGHAAMIAEVHRLISEADAVSTYNGHKFDLPILQGEFLLANLPPPPPVTGIDVYLTIRKMGFLSAKLGYVLPHLGLGGKLKHDGLDMWLDAMDGCDKARRKMAKYCKRDVTELEALYRRVLPYISTHPHMGATAPDACGKCGSTNTQSRGFHRTKASRVQRIQCQDCGGWQLGKRFKA
jgi:uncharacterized protein YprB with RNaseH-like and TPR domain